MTIDRDVLDAAHQHCACHRQELEASDVCGCFYCQQTFPPSEIEEWHEELRGKYVERPDPWTAMCPKCGVDSVIGSASGFPVGDSKFLGAMHVRWFS